MSIGDEIPSKPVLLDPELSMILSNSIGIVVEKSKVWIEVWLTCNIEVKSSKCRGEEALATDAKCVFNALAEKILRGEAMIAYQPPLI